jgi:hypothetical protein
MKEEEEEWLAWASALALWGPQRARPARGSAGARAPFGCVAATPPGAGDRQTSLLGEEIAVVYSAERMLDPV